MPDPRKLPMLHRAFEGPELPPEGRAEGDQRKYTFSVSSEVAIERWFGMEVLSHDEGAIDKRYLKGGLSVMAADQIGGHWGTQVGIFENGRIEGGKLKGDVRFSRSAKGQEVEGDVQDRIRTQVSLGYRVMKAKVVKGEGGKPDTWNATRWMPVEVHILPLAADVSVGLERGDNREEFEVEIESDGQAVPQEERTMVPEPETTPQPNGARSAVEVQPPPASAPEPKRDRNAEVQEILAICQNNNLSERASEWIGQGLTPQQVGYEIVKARKTAGTGQPAAERTGMPDKDLARYSYTRALRMSTEAAKGERSGFDGLEGELHKELARGLPANYQSRGGILVPMRLGTRALDSKTAGAGAEFVQDSPGELIDLLRARAMVVQMGARLLTGLTGPLTFPKKTAGMTVYWVGENPAADVTKSDVATGQVFLTPKTMQGATSYSRQLLAQSSIDVEAMVRDELAMGHALAIDLAGLHGSGVNGEPTGIYTAPDVQPQAMGGVPTHAKIVGMQGLAADKNVRLVSPGYMTTPLMASLMMCTLEASAAGSKMIWTGPIADGFMAGYRAVSTSQVSKTLEASTKHGLIFGDWNDLLIGLWDAMELVVDPYTQAGKGLIVVTSFQMGDVVLRHGESFVKATGATIS
jgi:HK97 family phage major capsid protein